MRCDIGKPQKQNKCHEKNCFVISSHIHILSHASTIARRVGWSIMFSWQYKVVWLASQTSGSTEYGDDPTQNNESHTW